MKVYEAVFKEGETEGVYALSVVENPAMQDMWIALNEHPKQIELSAVDNEKRLLLGAALIPDKKIYRNVDGHEFYITFSSETIEKLAHNFFKKGNQNNSSLEHQVKLEGMSVVEGWTVENPKNDKSNNYGKEYPKGTFVTMMKVDNDDVWQKVKNGEIKGFSIDALLGLQEIKLNTDTMNKQDFIDAFNEVMPSFMTLKAEKEDVKKEVVETPQFDIEAFKAVLTEQLAKVVESTDEKIEALKLEFTTQLEAKDEEVKAKDEEIKNLEVKLSKEPEVTPIKSKPQVDKVQIQNNRPETMQDKVFRNLQNVWQ